MKRTHAIHGPIVHGTDPGYQQERIRGLATCPDCRAAHSEVARRYRESGPIGRELEPCGTVASYHRGCRCDDCRSAIAQQRRIDRVLRARVGKPIDWKRKTEPKKCPTCGAEFIGRMDVKFCSRECAHGGLRIDGDGGRRNSKFYVPPAVRRAIYERDGWVCQICGESVDSTLSGRAAMGPTLDHIECQSWSLVPDNRPENLRLAHHRCNSKRGNRNDEPDRVVRVRRSPRRAA